MSERPALILCVGDPASDEPLPQRYLNLPGIQVSPVRHRGSEICPRCEKTWGKHDWLVHTPDTLPVVIDCSEQARYTERRYGE